MAGTLFDVTERKRSEQTYARLASIVESSDDAMIATALDGTISAWNPAAGRLYGYSEIEMLGQNIERLIPEHFNGQMRAIHRQLQSGVRVPPFESQRIRKDGSVVEVFLWISPILDTDGRSNRLRQCSSERPSRNLEDQQQRLPDLVEQGPPRRGREGARRRSLAGGHHSLVRPCPILGAGDSRCDPSAEHNGAIYLDLCNEQWQAVKVTPEGWSIVESHELPVRFIRRRGQKPLPAPEREGKIDEFRAFVNVPADDQWRLLVAWIIGALRRWGPFAVLTVQGEQGAAKSTLCGFVRSLIDPNIAPLRRPPRKTGT
jgi:PAS domain S-box-containing protein